MGDDYKTAQEKLNVHFSPKKNVDYEIFQFRQAVQQPGETVDQFATRLRKIAINCEFHDISKEIKAVIIQNCQSKRLRRYTLREDALTLDDLLGKACSLEASKMQATGMEKSPLHMSEEVNQVHHGNHEDHREKNPNKHIQTHVVSVDLHGHTIQVHVWPKAKPAENVESQITLQRCVSPSPL